MPQSLQQDLYDEFSRALAGLCPLERVREIEAAADAADPQGVAARTWREIDALGYVDALTPADLGGAGLSLADAEGLWRAAGAAALPRGATCSLRKADSCMLRRRDCSSASLR